MLKFVEAVMGYCDVFKEIKPKREKVSPACKAQTLPPRDPPGGRVNMLLAFWENPGRL